MFQPGYHDTMSPDTMLSRAPVSPPPDHRRTSAPDLEGMRWSIRIARPELAEESPGFQTALLLLLGREMGHNVDRLARVSGFPRDFVAKCTRRLFDNGVWQDGRTVCDWSEDEASFWADVEVAEGKLYRRVAADGTHEWAPVGQWWKCYDFVSKVGDAGSTVSYHAATHADPEPAAGLLVAAEGEDDSAAAVTDWVAEGWRADGAEPAGLEFAPIGGPEVRGVVSGGSAPRPDVSVPVELFPDAVWLQ
jgi:hypothetical protein